MSMFSFGRFQQRLRDMGTLKALCQGAEQQAHRDGQAAPGAEHFLLAALELPDATARRAFEQVAAAPDGVREAIARQHREALQSVGVDPAAWEALHDTPPPPVASPKLYQAQASGQAVVQALAALRQQGDDRPLVGAHVVALVAAMEHGVAPRALRAMGVDLGALAQAAQQAAGARPAALQPER